MLRVMPMPVADLLNEWFESDIVKGAIAASALINSSLGPQEAGTVYTFLYNWAGSNNGLFRSSGNIVGGMGALSEALVQMQPKNLLGRDKNKFSCRENNG